MSRIVCVLLERRKICPKVISRSTGLLRCYVSRVENGHTVPAVETLEKFARALEVPLYELLYEGDEPPQKHPALELRVLERTLGMSGKDARYLKQIIGSCPRWTRKIGNCCCMSPPKWRRERKVAAFFRYLRRWQLSNTLFHHFTVNLRLAPRAVAPPIARD